RTSPHTDSGQTPRAAPIVSRRLLEWLDGGVDSRGERYVEMRRRLVAYFDRRNRSNADGLADETFRRIGTRLERADGTQPAGPPAAHCYAIARVVLLEDVAANGLARVEADDPHIAPIEHRDDHLDRCVRALPADQRRLLVEYYRASTEEQFEHRRKLAKRLGLTIHVLGMNAFRIREALMQQCSRLR